MIFIITLLFLLMSGDVHASGKGEKSAEQFILEKLEECRALSKKDEDALLAQEQQFFETFDEDVFIHEKCQKLIKLNQQFADGRLSEDKHQSKYKELLGAMTYHGFEHAHILRHPHFLALVELHPKSYFYFANQDKRTAFLAKVFYPLISCAISLHQKDIEERLLLEARFLEEGLTGEVIKPFALRHEADIRLLTNVLVEVQELVVNNKEKLERIFKGFTLNAFSPNNKAFVVCPGLDKRAALGALSMISKMFSELSSGPIESWMYEQVKLHNESASSATVAASGKENTPPQLALTDEQLAAADEELIAAFDKGFKGLAASKVFTQSSKNKSKKGGRTSPPSAPSGKKSPSLDARKEAQCSQDVRAQDEEPVLPEFGNEPVFNEPMLLVKIGYHTIAQPVSHVAHEDNVDFEQFCTIQGSQVTMKQHKTKADWMVIDDAKENALVTLKLNAEVAADMPAWIWNGDFSYHARVKGDWSRKDYRHKFPFIIDKNCLPSGTYSLRKNDSGVLEPHIEINAKIQHRDETGNVVSSFNCVLEYTFDEVTHTCYHRFARKQ